MPLRFCMITTFYPPYSFGGDAIYLFNLCDLLARSGHEVDVIHCLDSYHLYKSEPESKHYPEQPGVRVHRLKSSFGPLSPVLSHQTGFPILKISEIHKVFASKHFDVIHYHNTSLLGPGVLALTPEYEGFVKLYTAHEHWLVCPMNVLWKYTGEACERPECFRCMLASRRPPQLWRYTKLLERSGRFVDLFLAPSRYTARIHQERGFPYPLRPLAPFTLRRDGEWRQPGPRLHPRPYFLFAGRLEEIKGLQNVVPEFAGPGDYDLVVAGTGTYEARLREQARGMERVKFTSWLSQEQLGGYYAHSLGVVVPSITYETFGLSTIEAFSRRRPAIVNNLGPLPEIIEQSGGGLVSSSPAEMRHAMDLLARNRELADRLGQHGYEAFLSFWTPERHLREYLSIIEETQHKVYKHL